MTKRAEVHKDPAEHAPQDDYHPASHQQAQPEENLEPEAVETPTEGEDGQEHVDLFV